MAYIYRIYKGIFPKYGVSTPYLISLLLFSIPLGLNNSSGQPLAALALLPYVVLSLKRTTSYIIPCAYFIVSAIFSAIIAEESPNFYQAARSGLPFFFGIVFLSSAGLIYRRFKSLPSGVGDLCIRVFMLGVSVQDFLFILNIPGYNSSFSSIDEGRIYILQYITPSIILYYGLQRNSIYLVFTCLFSLFISGGKSTFAVIFVVFLFDVLSFNCRKGVYTILMFLAVATYINVSELTALNRALQFWAEGAADSARTWEIYHAQLSFERNVWTVLLGNGLSTPVTPGFPTTDPAWFENSKFDIENLYWSVLAKFGIVGSAVLIFLLSKLPRTRVSLVFLSIHLIIGLGSSGLLLTSFDGPYLLVWTLLVMALCDGTSRAERAGRFHRRGI